MIHSHRELSLLRRNPIFILFYLLLRFLPDKGVFHVFIFLVLGVLSQPAWYPQVTWLVTCDSLEAAPS